MKIAVLSSQLPSPSRAKSGGVAYAAHRLANALAQRGHRVTVFTTDERSTDVYEEILLDFKEGICQARKRA